jgi:8-oxo-dGTP pyrophosphatase MutT (NUDIX family)
MSFSIPHGVVFAMDAVRLRLDAAPHPYETQNAQAIELNWQRERARNPALFDGRTALMSELHLRNRRLEGVCHTVRFATLMHWRRMGTNPGEHVFAHAMPVTADGALIAVRMAGHTANAGRVYFAAGSFEPEDFRSGFADADGNMLREVLEETGLDFTSLPREAGYHAHAGEVGTVIARRFYLDAPASEVAARIERFVAGETNPEIEAPVIIRGPGDAPDNLAPHMRPLIDWHFAAVRTDNT